METSLLKHLLTSIATSKGHVHKNQKGLQSTISNQEEIKEARKYLADKNRPKLLCATFELNVLYYAALAGTVTVTIYTDLPGRFLVQSIRNMSCIFVCYTYKANVILVIQMKNWGDKYSCMRALVQSPISISSSAKKSKS